MSNEDFQTLDLDRFASLLKKRRGALSLRQAAAEAEVSFSTFTRVESGSQPDIVSFTKLCAWLGVHPSEFFSPVATKKHTGIEKAMSHLRQDPNLTVDALLALEAVLTQLYNSLAKPFESSQAVSCHLRAATVLRPGVPTRLSSLLVDMEKTCVTWRISNDTAKRLQSSG